MIQLNRLHFWRVDAVNVVRIGVTVLVHSNTLLRQNCRRHSPPHSSSHCYNISLCLCTVNCTLVRGCSHCANLKMFVSVGIRRMSSVPNFIALDFFWLASIDAHLCSLSLVFQTSPLPIMLYLERNGDWLLVLAHLYVDVPPQVSPFRPECNKIMPALFESSSLQQRWRWMVFFVYLI